MNRSAVKAGVLGGILGGVLMAAWLMLILWLTGVGFWTLLNLITNTFWRGAPLGPAFSAAALVIGLIVHVMLSVLFGVLIAIAASRLPGSRSLVIAAGGLFGAVLWAVMQYGIWRAADPAAARVITPWLFASAHLIFGLMVVLVAAILVPDDEGTHTLGHAPSAAQDLFTPAAGSVLPQRWLTARNDGGMRTIVYTDDGFGMVTDEAAGYRGTAPTPMETVVGALCGSIGVTFAKAAREIGLGYQGIDFEAAFTSGPRDPASRSAEAPRFQAVTLRVTLYDAQPDAWLADVSRVALRNCPVRRLLADAGVGVEITWAAVTSEEASLQMPLAVAARRWTGR